MYIRLEMVNKNDIKYVSLVESLFKVNIIYYDLCDYVLRFSKLVPVNLMKKIKIQFDGNEV